MLIDTLQYDSQTCSLPGGYAENWVKSWIFTKFYKTQFSFLPYLQQESCEAYGTADKVL